MLEKIIEFSIRRRWLVLLTTLAMALVGIRNYAELPIDAVPDITNVQVQINTEAPGYSPLEVEQRITFPVETAIAGIPALEYTRSLSRYGLSQVTPKADAALLRFQLHSFKIFKICSRSGSSIAFLRSVVS